MKYRAITGNENFEIKGDDAHWQIDKELFELRKNNNSKSIFEITDEQGVTHQAMIQHIDGENKQVKVSIGQKQFVVDILEDIDKKMLALGIDIKELSKAKNIKAPMPGLILKTLVTEGQLVKSGEPLFVLEAMKMENVFKAPADVEIKTILIKDGETVDKNQELIVFA